MVKITISYETSEERLRVMQQLDPILRNAKVKENHNSKKYNRIHIRFQPEKLER